MGRRDRDGRSQDFGWAGPCMERGGRGFDDDTTRCRGASSPSPILPANAERASDGVPTASRHWGIESACSPSWPGASAPIPPTRFASSITFAGEPGTRGEASPVHQPLDGQNPRRQSPRQTRRRHPCRRHLDRPPQHRPGPAEPPKVATATPDPSNVRDREQASGIFDAASTLRPDRAVTLLPWGAFDARHCIREAQRDVGWMGRQSTTTRGCRRDAVGRRR
jgi:hypothetical protein